MYVLENEDGHYYTGDTYQFQGQIFAAADRDIENAKVYSSKNRADRALESLNKKCANYEFEVKELAACRHRSAEQS